MLFLSLVYCSVYRDLILSPSACLTLPGNRSRRNSLAGGGHGEEERWGDYFEDYSERRADLAAPTTVVVPGVSCG
jgi:hypothetical protein